MNIGTRGIQDGTPIGVQLPMMILARVSRAKPRLSKPARVVELDARDVMSLSLERGPRLIHVEHADRAEALLLSRCSFQARA